MSQVETSFGSGRVCDYGRTSQFVGGGNMKNRVMNAVFTFLVDIFARQSRSLRVNKELAFDLVARLISLVIRAR